MWRALWLSTTTSALAVAREPAIHVLYYATYHEKGLPTLACPYGVTFGIVLVGCQRSTNRHGTYVCILCMQSMFLFYVCIHACIVADKSPQRRIACSVFSARSGIYAMYCSFTTAIPSSESGWEGEHDRGKPEAPVASGQQRQEGVCGY
jgi:hypothetical protein